MATRPPRYGPSATTLYGDMQGASTKGLQASSRHRKSRVQRMRDTLRKNGYDIEARGPMTHRMLRAWHDYRTGGHPHRWNAANVAGRGKVPADVAKGVTGLAKNVIKTFSGGKGVVKKDLVKGAVQHSATKSRAAASAAKLGVKGHTKGGTGVPGLPKLTLPSTGKTNVNQLLPVGLAGKVAGLEFDPQIREAQLQQGYGKRDEAQAQRDLSSWYGQVRGSQETAGQRDTAAADSARTSVGNELQGIIKSLGGSRGAGVVGAEGLADLTALAAQGQSQEQYNADLAPILAGEEAGQHSRQAALASQAASKLGNQIIDLRGQRGQAEAKALLSILPLNNQTRQQNFSNRLAVQNAALAAKSLGVNTALDVAKVKLASQGQNQQYKLSRQKLGLAGGSNKPPVWANLNALDRQKVINSAVAQAASEIPVKKGEDHWDPTHVMNSALTLLRSGGLTSARHPTYRGAGVNKRNQVQILGAVNRGIAAARQHYKTLAGLDQTA